MAKHTQSSTLSNSSSKHDASKYTGKHAGKYTGKDVLVKKESTRQALADTLIEIGHDRRIVVLDADLAESTKTIKFKQVHPDRFFDMGVAEQNLITTAAGFASCGMIPFACGFAVFLTGRSYDQVRLQAGVSHFNIKIVGSHAGLLTGEDGGTHQALEDIGAMRNIPGIIVISPADYNEAKGAIKWAAKHKGPVYLRLGREKIPIVYAHNGKKLAFVFNKAVTLTIKGNGIKGKRNDDIAIIATGPMVEKALSAAGLLAKHRHISARVINISTLKPVDKATIIKAAKETKGIITVEDHSINCGLGSIVAEVLSENHPKRLLRIGVKDRFGESGTAVALYRKFGLTDIKIAQASLDFYRKL